MPLVKRDGSRCKQQNPKIGEIKVETLIDSSVIKKIEDSGFFEKMAAEYGVR